VDTVAVIVLWERNYPRRFLAPVLSRVRGQPGRGGWRVSPHAAGRHGGWVRRWIGGAWSTLRCRFGFVGWMSHFTSTRVGRYPWIGGSVDR